MRRLALALLAALLPICAAQATPVTFSFTGVVDNDPFGVFDSATFDGTYTFDSNIPQVLATPNSGGYADTGASVNMTVSFTGTLDPTVAGPYTADTLNITVNNDFPGPLDECPVALALIPRLMLPRVQRPARSGVSGLYTDEIT